MRQINNGSFGCYFISGSKLRNAKYLESHGVMARSPK